MNKRRFRIKLLASLVGLGLVACYIWLYASCRLDKATAGKYGTVADEVLELSLAQGNLHLENSPSQRAQIIDDSRIISLEIEREPANSTAVVKSPSSHRFIGLPSPFLNGAILFWKEDGWILATELRKTRSIKGDKRTVVMRLRALP